jgi:hypothetical protein
MGFLVRCSLEVKAKSNNCCEMKVWGQTVGVTSVPVEFLPLPLSKAG